MLINITGGSDMTLFEVNEASMLVQEAAHEDANIIFGAVIDEDVPEGELRVTVIATGLDDGHARRGVPRGKRAASQRAGRADLGDEQLEIEDIGSRQRPAAPAQTSPAMERQTVEHAPQAGESAEQSQRGDADFASPFDDEFDTPAFIRRRTDEGDDDREVPTFLRRAQD